MTEDQAKMLRRGDTIYRVVVMQRERTVVTIQAVEFDCYVANTEYLKYSDGVTPVSIAGHIMLFFPSEKEALANHIETIRNRIVDHHLAMQKLSKYGEALAVEFERTNDLIYETIGAPKMGT